MKLKSPHLLIFHILLILNCVFVTNAYFQNAEYPEAHWRPDSPVRNTYPAMVQRYEDITSRMNDPISGEEFREVREMREKPTYIDLEV